MIRTCPPLWTALGRIQDDRFARRQPILHFNLIQAFRAKDDGAHDRQAIRHDEHDFLPAALGNGPFGHDDGRRHRSVRAGRRRRRSRRRGLLKRDACRQLRLDVSGRIQNRHPDFDDRLRAISRREDFAHASRKLGVRIRLELDGGRQAARELPDARLGDFRLDFELAHVGDRGDGAAFARSLTRHAERRNGFANLRSLLDHHAVERRADVCILERFLNHVDAGARGDDSGIRGFHTRGRHRGGRLGGRQRSRGRDAILRQRTLPFELLHIVVVGRRRLRELGLRFGHGGCRRGQLRVEIRVLDAGNHLAATHVRAFLKTERLQPPARLDAHVAAATGDDVSGGDEDGNGGRTAVGGRRNLRGAGDFDFGGSGPIVILARRRVEPTRHSEHDDEQHPRQPPASRRDIAIDAQARQIADRS